jgi:flagellar biosynthesis protein FlhG
VPLDVLIIDTAAGTSHSVTSFTRAAQDMLVAVCDEPASIIDVYALIKVLSREGPARAHQREASTA